MWSIKEIKEVLNNQNINDAIAITGASIDTRTIREGDMFFALSGNNFDGNEFVDIAFQKGASLCFSDNVDKVSIANQRKVIVVHKVAKILVDFAIYRRRLISGIVIGITGSTGKTSTKTMLELSLSHAGKVYASTNNFNNHYGLPLSLINCPKDIDFCILELGMKKKGEILYLASISKPNISIITNIYPVHLGFFTSYQDIAYAKSEIFFNMQEYDFAILNRGSFYFNIQYHQAKHCGLEVLTFGQDSDASCYIKKIIKDNFFKKVAIRIFHQSFEQRFDINIGDHLIYNALSIFICIHVLNIKPVAITKILSHFHPQIGRGVVTILSKSIKLIDESYNSNPMALMAAIKNALSIQQEKKGRILAVLGDMRELGDQAIQFHKDINLSCVDKIFCVGPLMKYLYDNSPVLIRGIHTNTANEMSKIINGYIQDNDIILVKGSLSIQMRLIIYAIKYQYL